MDDPRLTGSSTLLHASSHTKFESWLYISEPIKVGSSRWGWLPLSYLGNVDMPRRGLLADGSGCHPTLGCCRYQIVGLVEMGIIRQTMLGKFFSKLWCDWCGVVWKVCVAITISREEIVTWLFYFFFFLQHRQESSLIWLRTLNGC